MGDKSPKAKDKAKKQDTAGKDKRKAESEAKQRTAAPVANDKKK